MLHRLNLSVGGAVVMTPHTTLKRGKRRGRGGLSTINSDVELRRSNFQVKRSQSADRRSQAIGAQDLDSTW